MSFFTNKHVITAMVVAPILAVISYFTVDMVVKEAPTAAVPGQSYPLLAKPNCRYTSGACTLVNADFKSELVVISEASRDVLQLTASHTLQDVKIGFSRVKEDPPAEPQSMRAQDAKHKVWSIALPLKANEENKLVIAILSNGSHYYAETAMGFAEYKTSFHKDFTQN